MFVLNRRPCTFISGKVCFFLIISKALTKHEGPNCLLRSRTGNAQWMHKSKKSENLGRCGRQNMLRPYLIVWNWELIFGRAVKAISSLDVCSPWSHSWWSSAASRLLLRRLCNSGVRSRAQMKDHGISFILFVFVRNHSLGPELKYQDRVRTNPGPGYLDQKKAQA